MFFQGVQMVFSSLIFLYAFLPLSLLAYFLCPTLKSKNISLLVSSLIFYAWGEPVYVFLLAAMAFISWFCAKKISVKKSQHKKKIFLTAAIAADLVLIAFFKYASLICSIFGQVPAFIKNIALPIGISFYTFQLLTYVVDVYRGEANAKAKYWDVLLYASLFHQCIAGPIVRYKSISKELYVYRSSKGNLVNGIKRFTVGLAKKALLANPCGALSDSIFTNIPLNELSAVSAWTGMIAFMLQIYLDFSAYSDMAIGMGSMLGLHYPENFNYPYIARSVRDFWHRWHISLSTFFRDYVYIPLGGSRCSSARNILNLFIVWFLTGLWHGASWNFVLWGLYFFVFLVLEKFLLGSFLERHRVFSHIYLLIVILFGWIIFNFTSIGDGWTVFKSMLCLNGNLFSDFVSVTMLTNNLVILIVSAFCSTPAIKLISGKLESRFSGNRYWEFICSGLVPIILLLLSTAALVGDSYNPFIYFQF